MDAQKLSDAIEAKALVSHNGRDCTHRTMSQDPDLPDLPAIATRRDSPWTNGAIVTALLGLNTLSRIGVKDIKTLKRLTKMLIWANKAVEEYFISRDTLVSTWGERDPETDEIRIADITGPDNQRGQVPLMRNGVEYNLASNKLLRETARFQGEPPDPFTWDDLERFNKRPDALTIAQLGPFVNID